MIENRPMHCAHTEIVAQDINGKYQGLGASTLLKLYHFACSTPLFSPPTLSASKPTDVITTTIKYLEQFLHERQLDDPLPASWVIPYATVKSSDVVEIPKESIHFFDADSAVIYLEQNDQPILKQLSTSDKTIRIRMQHHDAPETKFSVRIYKQSEAGGQTMTNILTRHIGIEALRFVRKTVHEAYALGIVVPRHADGSPSVPVDFYGRRLLDVVLLDQGRKEHNSLSHTIAAAGYTMSYYTTGIEETLHNHMREAIAAKLGIFNLPHEVFTYPNRPWELRHLWERTPEIYKEYQPILNTQSQHQRAWLPGTTSFFPMLNPGEIESAPINDKFYFRMVECNCSLESHCFKGVSNIPGAGCGLFLRPHDLVKKGEHLCLYAASSTTNEEMDRNKSSRDYAIYVSRTNTWFDSEVDTGVNLGRFANQPHVLQSLRSIRNKSDISNPALAERDWASEEAHIDERCNVEFKTHRGQIVLVAKKDLPASGAPDELLVNYGSLRDYWIPAIQRNINTTPKELAEIVNWMSHSNQCNWDPEHKKLWLGS